MAINPKSTRTRQARTRQTSVSRGSGGSKKGSRPTGEFHGHSVSIVKIKDSLNSIHYERTKVEKFFAWFFSLIGKKGNTNRYEQQVRNKLLKNMTGDDRSKREMLKNIASKSKIFQKKIQNITPFTFDDIGRFNAILMKEQKGSHEAKGKESSKKKKNPQQLKPKAAAPVQEDPKITKTKEKLDRIVNFLTKEQNKLLQNSIDKKKISQDYLMKILDPLGKLTRLTKTGIITKKSFNILFKGLIHDRFSVKPEFLFKMVKAHPIATDVMLANVKGSPKRFIAFLENDTLLQHLAEDRMNEAKALKVLGIKKDTLRSSGKKYPILREAYKRLALEYHPDKNRGNEKKAAKFKNINEANGYLNIFYKNGD